MIIRGPKEAKYTIVICNKCFLVTGPRCNICPVCGHKNPWSHFIYENGCKKHNIQCYDTAAQHILKEIKSRIHYLSKIVQNAKVDVP